MEWSRNCGKQIVDITAIQSLVHGEFRRSRVDAGFEQTKDLLLDGVLFAIGKLIATMAENLDTVVLVRIMRGRDHYSSDEGIGVGQERHARGGHHAGEA